MTQACLILNHIQSSALTAAEEAYALSLRISVPPHEKGRTYVEPKVLVRWLVLMFKFPWLVRWIQWDLENKPGNNISAEQKAIDLDRIIEGFIDQANGSDPDYVQWKKLGFPESLHPMGETSAIGELEEMAWTKSPGMFRIMTSDCDPRNRLANALKCNVW